MTSANAGEGENELCIELECDSDVTSESVKDCLVVQRRVQVSLVVFRSSREPRTLYTNRETFLGISFIYDEKSVYQSE